MQNCPPRSLPQALGGGPAGGARLRFSDAPAFDIRSVTAGVRRVHHPRPEVRLLAQTFVLWSGVGLASPGLCFEFRVRRRIRLAGSRLRSQTKPSSVMTAAQISGRRSPNGHPCRRPFLPAFQPASSILCDFRAHVAHWPSVEQATYDNPWALLTQRYEKEGQKETFVWAFADVGVVRRWTVLVGMLPLSVVLGSGSQSQENWHKS